jgi:hypothetical protein
MEAMLLKAAMKIVTTVGREKDHIPVSRLYEHSVLTSFGSDMIYIYTFVLCSTLHGALSDVPTLARSSNFADAVN